MTEMWQDRSRISNSRNWQMVDWNSSAHTASYYRTAVLKQSPIELTATDSSPKSNTTSQQLIKWTWPAGNVQPSRFLANRMPDAGRNCRLANRRRRRFSNFDPFLVHNRPPSTVLHITSRPRTWFRPKCTGNVPRRIILTSAAVRTRRWSLLLAIRTVEIIFIKWCNNYAGQCLFNFPNAI